MNEILTLEPFLMVDDFESGWGDNSEGIEDEATMQELETKQTT